MDVNSLGLEDYWSDLVRLLLVFALTKKRPAAENREKVDALAQAMSSDFFRPYISDRKRRIG
jgi:hypothetical protein